MLQALAEEHSDREIWWLHGARNGHEHSFAAETRALLASLPNTCSYVYYSRPGPDDVKGRDFDAAGRLTGSVLARSNHPATRTHICAGLGHLWTRSAPVWRASGSPRQTSTPSRSALHPADAGHRSDAHAAAPPTRRRAGSGPTIEFARSDLAIPWSDAYASLLELAEACDVPVRWSCRTGVCQTCETTLIAGRRRLQPRPSRAAPRRKRAHLLLTTTRRHRARPVTGCSRTEASTRDSAGPPLGRAAPSEAPTVPARGRHAPLYGCRTRPSRTTPLNGCGSGRRRPIRTCPSDRP